MNAFNELGFETAGINIAKSNSASKRFLLKIGRLMGRTLDLSDTNQKILSAIEINKYDIVWIDKGVTVKSSTLRIIKEKQPDCVLVHLNPDDPFGKYRTGWDVFLKAIPEYDVHFVARIQSIEEYNQYGAKNVYVFDRSYSKNLHRPLDLPFNERTKYEVSVGFIGSHADDRADKIAHLIKNGIPVCVYGDGWKGKSHWKTIQSCHRGPSRYAEEYVKTINGMGIALHFLRHENRDEQDSRTFEIPACGAFMLAERSGKHEMFFKENEEAVFFDTADELLEKARYYLDRPEERAHIAAAGRRRCVESGYDHHSRMKHLLEIVKKVRPE
ncbi:MAG: glycosyltransferase [Lewinellaceae bacterium]|nr:glycosyltransferase [Lewinellaceae bacterium]